MEVTNQHVREIQALIETNDLSLDERRETFKRIAGRETTLTPEKLVIAIAATTDDDDNLFVKCVKDVEAGNVKVI